MPSTSSPPPVYSQTCSVCNAECFGENEWLEHLVQEDHQQLARQECLGNWERKIRKKCLLVFTKVALTENTAGKIVDHFSKKLSGGSSLIIVTDFVWWEDRPKIGILQFESKEKVNEVLIALVDQHSKTIKVDEKQRIQLKAGSELKSLEWSAILPPPPSHQISSPSVSETGSSREDVNDEESSPPSKRPRLDNNSITTGNTPNHQSQLINSSSILYSGRPPPSVIMTPSSHPLQFEYWSIRKAMIARDVQYEYVRTAEQSLKSTLSTLDPNLEVGLFRNWFLKLKYPSANNDVLLYVHSNKPSQTSNMLCKHVGNSNQREFKVLKSRKEGQHGLLYLKHVPSKQNIFLVTSQTKGSCLLEVQVCRLMEYMCQFDPRCYSLITLACYWVTLNSINVGGKVDTENLTELHPQYTIQWLVLYFMYHQKLIPTPKEIMKRCDFDGRKLEGFRFDPKFVEEWRSEKAKWLAARQQFCVGVDESSEEFILSLFKLFYKFISFCSGSLSSSDEMTLNLYNGTIILRYNNLRNYMTPEEVHIFKQAINRPTAKQQLEKRGFFMTHPIELSHSLSISENIKSEFRSFGESCGNLTRFLDCVDKLGVENALKEMGGLKTVLTMDG